MEEICLYYASQRSKYWRWMFNIHLDWHSFVVGLGFYQHIDNDEERGWFIDLQCSFLMFWAHFQAQQNKQGWE